MKPLTVPWIEGSSSAHSRGASIMWLNIGGPLASSHVTLYPLQTHASSRTQPTLACCSGRLHLMHDQHSGMGSSGSGSMGSVGINRRRTRQHTASGPRLLHPSGKGPEGVPSSLFTFRPKDTAKKQEEDMHMGNDNADATSTMVRGGDLYAGLMEESDLPDISALLVEVFEAGVVLADGEFSGLESVILGAPVEMTNNYLNAVAYNEILFSFKSRCGNRLKRGDFDRSSDALVLGVRDRSSGGGDGAGELVGVVELTIRQPDGSLPFNWPFPAPWRQPQPPEQWEPYMCNLAIAEKYRGNGYGKQLVRLCEHVAKNHWGYERMYLHVDMGDPAATGLYSSMGYESLVKYDSPLWMRRLFGWPTIRYQVKHFKGRKGAAAVTAAAGSEKSGI